ncbi:hypothetical protein [Paraburkholderia sp. 40]|uniref:hypothetical protein n=1 Tax=Paraburkholderia sp. 40 TaxID=2991059 RepID=UPI003D23204C
MTVIVWRNPPSFNIFMLSRLVRPKPALSASIISVRLPFDRTVPRVGATNRFQSAFQIAFKSRPAVDRYCEPSVGPVVAPTVILDAGIAVGSRPIWKMGGERFFNQCFGVDHRDLIVDWVKYVSDSMLLDATCVVARASVGKRAYTGAIRDEGLEKVLSALVESTPLRTKLTAVELTSAF